MLYVLYEQDDECQEVLGVYEGPDGLDVARLRKKWSENFDCLPLVYPEYKGRKIPYKSPPNSCYSGFITPIEGSLIADETDPEWEKWQKEGEKLRKDWDKRRNKKIEEYQKRYGKGDLSTMFIRYLEVDFGFHKVESKEVCL
jgi:hypothetical protein